MVGSLDLCQRDLRRLFQDISRRMLFGMLEVGFFGFCLVVQAERVEEINSVNELISCAMFRGEEVFGGWNEDPLIFSSNLVQFVTCEGFGGENCEARFCRFKMIGEWSEESASG